MQKNVGYILISKIEKVRTWQHTTHWEHVDPHFLQLHVGILDSDWLKTVVNETTPLSSAGDHAHLYKTVTTVFSFIYMVEVVEKQFTIRGIG